MDADTIAPLVIFLVWAVSGLVRMVSKARQNRADAHGGMLDMEGQASEPSAAHVSAERSAPSRARMSSAPSPSARAASQPGGGATPSAASAAAGSPVLAPYDERTAAYDERTAAFGDTTLEFAVPPSEIGLGEPLPSGGFAPDQPIAPPSNVSKVQRPAARQKGRAPQATTSRSPRVRIGRLLGTRTGLADAVLAAEILGRPVSERQ